MDDGNVGQVVTMFVDEGTVYGDLIPAARYEYDLYGSQINAPAENEYEQPLRFSTKPWDPETGLMYFGLRYRDRERWISRNPMREPAPPMPPRAAAGFVPRDPVEDDSNLYIFARNRPNMAVDALGLEYLDYTTKRACCKYAETDSMTGTSRYQETVSCPDGAWLPSQCCTCCSSQIRGNLVARLRVRNPGGATWGNCCFCTVQVKKQTAGPFSWLFGSTAAAHEKIQFRCENGDNLQADLRGQATWYFLDEIQVSPAPPERTDAGYYVLYQFRVDCACAAGIMNSIRSEKGKDKYFYITGVRDCRRYARQWARRAAHCYRDPHFSESLPNMLWE